MKITFHSQRLDAKDDLDSYPEKTNLGYIFKTPCDIEFYHENDMPKINVSTKYKNFVQERGEVIGMKVPIGFSKYHFHWAVNWGPELPKGYSAIYLNPLNRFDLPFFNTSGIIDNDVVFTPGNLPFFIQEGYNGVIKKGTPYLQVVPFKREDWQSEIVFNQ